METSFLAWLETRAHRSELPEATRLSQLLAKAGATGIRRCDLGKAITLDRDVLDDLLAAMMAAGQAEVAEVGGERVYYRLS